MMKRILISILFLGLCASSVFASGQDMVMGQGIASNVPAGTSYGSILGDSNGYGGVVAERNQVSASSGVMRYLRCTVSVAPGAGKSRAMTVVEIAQDGTTTDTALSCTISDTNTSCADLTNAPNLTEGYLYYIKSVPANTPTASSLYCTTITEFNHAIKQTVWHVVNDSTDLTATEYTILSGNGLAWGGSRANNSQPAPEAFTIIKMYVNGSISPGILASNVYTLYKNGAATELSCTISDIYLEGTPIQCSDSGSVSVAQNDLLSIEVVPSGSPLASRVTTGIDITPSYAGDSMYFGGGNGQAPTNSSTTYGYMSGRYSNTATESSTRNIIQSNVTWKNLVVKFVTAPGAGKSWVVTVYLDGSASNITCTVSDTNTTCSDLTHTAIGIDNGYISVQVTPSGTPTSGVFEYSIVGQLKRRIS